MTCRYDTEAGAYLRDGEVCHQPHCYTCATRHTDQATCPHCVGEGRETLKQIGELIADLPEEAATRGVASEAMNLLGPACDPEARGHLEASVAAGRLPAHYLDEADHELHPLLVLGNSQMVWADVLDHDLTTLATVSNAIRYLDANLTEMAQSELITYADDLDAWRKCLGHLRSVLRDTGQQVTGAPCLTCRINLRLEGELWVCRTCNTSRDQTQYDGMVRQGYLHSSNRLHIDDMAERTGVPKGTLRRWANVQRKITEKEIIETPPRMPACGVDSNGRKVYRVTVALALAGQRQASSG